MKLNRRAKIYILLGIGASFILCIWGIYMSFFYIDESSIELYFENSEENIKLVETEDYKVPVFINDKFKNKLIYESGNESIASVDKDGLVKAKKPGETTIDVYVKGTHKKITKKVEVDNLIKTEDVDIVNMTKKMTIGEEMFIKVNALPRNCSFHDVEFTTSDKKILDVSSDGKLKAVESGNAYLIVSVPHTQVKKEILIEVGNKYKTLSCLSFLEGKSGSVETGEQKQLHLVYEPENVKNKEVVYNSSDNSIATVSEDGLITTYRPGEVKITATSKANKKLIATYELNVMKTNGYLSKEILDNAGALDATKLMIVAHPDDDALWGGQHLSQGGWFVVCLTNEYNEKRKAEFNHAMDIAKAKRVILSYPDLVNYQRNKWQTCKEGIKNDFDLLMKYKNWDMIVTHNPDGEYGHIHHKMTSSLMTLQAKQDGTFSSLYYFGKFYKKVPKKENCLEKTEISKKQEIVDAYTTQLPAIERNWAQMIPYENWVKASDW